MKASLVLLALVWLAFPARAEQGATAVELDVAAPPTISESSSATADPPGAYYGDVSGIPASLARNRRSFCPPAADGSERDVTGSITTGVGYSSHGGSSTLAAADVNYCKETVDDDGNQRFIRINVDLERYDGPGYGAGYPGRYSPYGHRGSRR